ncbi:family 15 glycosyl hydrolase [Coemansia reversa NRRL 1564]|uniref:Family 15 glycosyl hydrolase n=1 Tax=Coemansia reversa (strain ATCC 12441 / NRRL 1564) TaxID=763665 RepID=A0A2G5BGJ1_COERN|nr:family 15 glycosyl hydrolase [Coemansia reversa NRRL 1564]|eukprot:PIA18146.1 family 15 glycosyl hydrolase [Coemansia reversa NRRL 1564]
MRRTLNGYLPIEQYGLIGNLHTAALVGMDGSIDFMCWPEFDSPSVFCRLLDTNKGGHFSITPSADATTAKQQYLPFSNVLSTKFLCEEGVGVVSDFMHRPRPRARSHSHLMPWLVRSVEVIRGTMTFDMECFPAFDYARTHHKLEIERHAEGLGMTSNAEDRAAQTAVHQMDLRYVVGCMGNGSCPSICLVPTDHPGGLGQGVSARFTLQEGQRVFFDISVHLARFDPPLSMKYVETLMEDTLMYWLTWIRSCTYFGRWRENVERSALILKLLTYEPTGAVVAAVTFSLPEAIGNSGRNWDYRFTWVRDSAFTMYAFMRLGLNKEAKSYMSFVHRICRAKNPDGSLQIMYTLRGGREMAELVLPHLEGYRSCAPVRIGNGAADHLQLDIYGELLDAVYLYNKFSQPLSYDEWVDIRALVDHVCDTYDQPDMGIWEVRGLRQNFTYSKVQCWVAVDRGLRLIDKRDFPCSNRDRWRHTRDQIYEEIMARAWNPHLEMFTQSYESLETLDAAVLAMPLVFFCDGTDPRFVKTMRRIMLPPHRGGLTTNNLVFRYNAVETDDGLSGEEGTFSLCTFWLAEALSRASKANITLLYKAQVIIDEMIMYGNHLGLFSEEIDKSGKHLGNFPQAFTHIALISAAYNVDRALETSHP